eukprot:11390054-Alexandrium_andersonii.AAC.1
MARVRLIQEPAWRPSDDAAQQLHFLQVRRASPEAPLYFAPELLAHQLFHDAQVRIVASKGKVAPVHDAPRVQLGI